MAAEIAAAVLLYPTIDEIMGTVPSLSAAACSLHPQAAFNRIIAY
jgi:hypothetical protein